MVKIPISGGPHSGKTTLLGALKREFPNAYYVPEPAERVIRRELTKQGIMSEYVPRVPWLDYATFGPEVADESITLENEIPPKATIVFQDRSLIDTIGYARLNGFDSFIPTVDRYVRAAKYSFALFCEPVGTYKVTDVRRETPEEAELTHNYLAQAYEQSAIPVIHLPAISTEQRIAVIRTTIDNLGL
jgi:predicted ATPase